MSAKLIILKGSRVIGFGVANWRHRHACGCLNCKELEREATELVVHRGLDGCALAALVGDSFDNGKTFFKAVAE